MAKKSQIKTYILKTNDYGDFVVHPNVAKSLDWSYSTILCKCASAALFKFPVTCKKALATIAVEPLNSNFIEVSLRPVEYDSNKKMHIKTPTGLWVRQTPYVLATKIIARFCRQHNVDSCFVHIKEKII